MSDTVSDIAATLNASTKDITITWTTLTNAKSYYVNLWKKVWNNSINDYEYQWVWGKWVNSNSTVVPFGDVASGLDCDVFVTAYEMDMTTTSPPSSVSRSDMSENYYGYPLPFLTP